MMVDSMVTSMGMRTEGLRERAMRGRTAFIITENDLGQKKFRMFPVDF